MSVAMKRVSVLDCGEASWAESAPVVWTWPNRLRMCVLDRMCVLGRCVHFCRFEIASQECLKRWGRLCWIPTHPPSRARIAYPLHNPPTPQAPPLTYPPSHFLTLLPGGPLGSPTAPPWGGTPGDTQGDIQKISQGSPQGIPQGMHQGRGSNRI